MLFGKFRTPLYGSESGWAEPISLLRDSQQPPGPGTTSEPEETGEDFDSIVIV